MITEKEAQEKLDLLRLQRLRALEAGNFVSAKVIQDRVEMMLWVLGRGKYDWGS
jgi:hypothetical protein